jgi:hypothetical protein
MQQSCIKGTTIAHWHFNMDINNYNNCIVQPINHWTPNILYVTNIPLVVIGDRLKGIPRCPVRHGKFDWLRKHQSSPQTCVATLLIWEKGNGKTRELVQNS